ncbi:hypothetical protein [Desulfosporosinus fructosivorans]
MAYKTVIWGIVGMLIVLMFSIFSNGVAGAVKVNLLFVGSSPLFYMVTEINYLCSQKLTL